MIDTSASRQAILSRIRGPRAGADPGLTARDYVEIGRAYVRAGSLNLEQRLDLFEERLVEYDAHVRRVSEPALQEAIAATIGERGAERIAVPSGLPARRLVELVRFGDRSRRAFQC